MRPMTKPRFVVGRFVFALLSVQLSSQLHIAAGGAEVPWSLRFVAAAGLLAMSFTSSVVVLPASVATQFLIHFGSSWEVFGGHCHTSHVHGMPLDMLAAHTAAALVGWALIHWAEAALIAAVEFISRAVRVLELPHFTAIRNLPLFGSRVELRSHFQHITRGRAPPVFH